MPKQLVPAYVWPTDDARWERLLVGPPGIVVVTGENSGPGSTCSGVLAHRIEWCRQRGWQPVGYVPLGYAGRPIGAVARDVERWRQWYPSVHGIFYDEAAAGDADVVPMLMAAASRLGPRCILNCGTAVNDAMWQATWPQRALIVTFEGPASVYDASAQSHARAVHLVHHAPTAPVWPRGLGWAWSTPDGADGNPWDGS